MTITGNAYVAAGTTLEVQGNLTLAPEACLDAFTLGTVKVNGNIKVGNGAVLGLGCSPGAIGPEPPCGVHTTNDVVNGNIDANQALTMYLTAVSVHGNVTSNGGGPGLTFHPYINFPIKENQINGNLVVQGWQGTWFGALRNTVHGNVVINNDEGVARSEDGLPDSTEIATNTINGNLVCNGNSPAAQLGDSGGKPNVVQGNKVGQCKAV